MTAFFVRVRKPGKRSEGWPIPDSFFAQFGPDTARVSIAYPGAPPKITTWAELGEYKRQRQREQLARKRQSWQTTVVPLYVWVFFCPGLGGFAFRGWWTYLIGCGIEYGRYLSRNDDLCEQIMELFPMNAPTLFGPATTLDEWMPLFAKCFACRNADGSLRKHAGRIQGKAFVWAEVRGGHIRRLLRRAEQIR